MTMNSTEKIDMLVHRVRALCRTYGLRVILVAEDADQPPCGQYGVLVETGGKTTGPENVLDMYGKMGNAALMSIRKGVGGNINVPADDFVKDEFWTTTREVADGLEERRTAQRVL